MDQEILLRKIKRLQKAREDAENILEAKAKELWEAKEALEEKVVIRTKELQTAKEKAEKAQQAEQQFLARMSHEIRTPLNAVVGMTHLLESTDLSEKQKNYITALKSSALILQNLISDILDLSKIDAGKFEVVNEDFNLREFSENLIDVFKSSAKSKGIYLYLDFDETINTSINSDTKLLNQVLINLIGNAIKFTEDGGVRLSINLIDKKEELQLVKFSVTDTGIGIEEEQIESVFEVFTQANSSIDRTYGGTGLGLSIAKKIIVMLDGILTVESKRNVGSTFSFSLPLKTLISNDKISSKVDVLAIKTKQLISEATVLLVEDNLMNQYYLQSLLDDWELKYDLASNGLEALDFIAKKSYEIILMDHQMPIMDGFEATTIIRETNKTVPIIALTASSMRQDKEAALNHGFSDFLTKPYTPTQLYELLLKYISSTKLS